MVFNVTEYGVVGDGITNNTLKIKQLIQSIRNTGGIIFFPTGRYVTGTIRLYSNMTMMIDGGAQIIGSNNAEYYPKINQDDAPGYTRNGYCGLITAFNCENITVCGNGTIDANGEFWWKSKESDLVRPRTINFVLCKDITIKDVTIKNSPCWTVHPMCCENVKIDSLTIRNPYNSPNTDGINPESCKNVRISNCCIDVGDDCITIKSGTEGDLLQKQYPCENITVSNCIMAHGHGGVVIGSEMSGGVKNVAINNCIFQNTDRGIRLKTRRKRGGYIKDIMVSNIIMENVIAAITINEYYCCGADETSEELFSTQKQPIDELTPFIEDIQIRGVIASNVLGAGIYMYGLPEMPMKNIVLNDINIKTCQNREGINVLCAPGRVASKGEGIVLENAENVFMNNINVVSVGKKLEVVGCKNIMLNGKNITDKT